jgi:hypothetical protein
MSFNIIDTVITSLNGNSEQDMTRIICEPLRMKPTQYHGPNTCYDTLKNLCNKAEVSEYSIESVNTLVDIADKCQAWFYPAASAVYRCASTTVVTVVTESKGNVDEDGVVTSDNNGEVIVGITAPSITFYYAGAPIVPSAPANNMQLYNAVKTCKDVDYDIYQTANLCSDNAGVSNSENYPALCIGAVLSTSPAWLMEEIG